MNAPGAPGSIRPSTASAGGKELSSPSGPVPFPAVQHRSTCQVLAAVRLWARSPYYAYRLPRTFTVPPLCNRTVPSPGQAATIAPAPERPASYLTVALRRSVRLRDRLPPSPLLYRIASHTPGSFVRHGLLIPAPCQHVDRTLDSRLSVTAPFRPLVIMALPTATSSIAMALAGKTASMDIPRPRDSPFASGGGRDSFAARSGHHHGQLPTPPNSISPSLPPQAFKHQAKMAGTPPSAPAQVDSDIDLQDATDHGKSQGQPQQSSLTAGLSGLESAGAITPAMLAKYHLPEILLNHGPLAIRHVMGYLTTSVPGFAGIPPAKARRLVVGALEGRGSVGEGGGVNGEVIFEKVGWGRWDARRRGQASRDRHAQNPSPPSSVPNSYHPQGMQIPNRRSWMGKENAAPYGTSMTGDSIVFSHSEEMEYGDHEDVSMLEHEADKMSLDGDGREYCSSSEAPDDAEDWDEGDVTDEEDWAQIGADALRARSFNSGGGIVHNNIAIPSRQPLQHAGGPVSSALAKSVPGRLPIQHIGFTLPEGLGGDQEERAAVEALLRLGSM
ncbi:hypothetical protein DTO169E5_1662 [Paecilomyces variotii]|nr:hypothetical protein DTO169C6_3140 [Paecilomyces variotii]KAJ9244444.1 hypothetical protein DTO169E5_1662 [Paecilomyces variotii]KAJ9291840.1 hypothetical protein DTO021C3_741 [Paecilomyces variotii]KAJ9399637.1 hypothetical protein DTO282F9_3511 [Paecilomyces variotii]